MARAAFYRQIAVSVACVAAIAMAVVGCNDHGGSPGVSHHHRHHH
jgi:anti-sigma-K factor RskA